MAADDTGGEISTLLGSQPADEWEIETDPLPEGAEVPVFTSSWSTEYTAAYRDSTSDLQRTILEDEAITDQEVVALQDAMRSCLESHGFTEVDFDAIGGFQERPPEGLSDDDHVSLVLSCEAASWGDGFESYALYFEILRNPGNADEAELMAECLVRIGLAAPAYTAESYRADSEAGNYPFDSTDDRFRECGISPLTAGTQ